MNSTLKGIFASISLLTTLPVAAPAQSTCPDTPSLSQAIPEFPDAPNDFCDPVNNPPSCKPG